MTENINNLKQFGNLLEKLLDFNTKIDLIRVYGYGSHVGNIYYRWTNLYIKNITEEEKNLLDVIEKIRKKVEELNWNDNKIVVEVIVNNSWRIFIGYYDHDRTIGGSVIPNLNLPKFKMDSVFKILQKINIR